MPCHGVSCSWLDGGRQEHPHPHLCSVRRGSRCSLLGQRAELSGPTLSFHAVVFLTQTNGNAGDEPAAVGWSRLGRGCCRGEGSRDGAASSALPGVSSVVWERQGFCLPSHRSRTKPSALRQEDLAQKRCGAGPGDCAGGPAEGSPCRPPPALAARRGCWSYLTRHSDAQQQPCSLLKIPFPSCSPQAEEETAGCGGFTHPLPNTIPAHGSRFPNTSLGRAG